MFRRARHQKVKGVSVLLLLILGLAAFAYFALNAGEKKGQSPGINGLLIVVVVCFVGYLVYPYIRPMVDPIMNAIMR